MRNILLAALGLLFVGAGTASSQVARHDGAVSLGPVTVEHDGPRILHVTDRLMALPETRAAIQEYLARKEAGLLQVARKTEATVGTQQTFKVRNISTGFFDSVDFTLMVTRDRFNIWLETVQYPDSVSDAVLENLRAAMEDETPFGSVNQSAGIIVNDETYFGSPPDVDGDGKTDVMILNIRDDCNTTDVCVLGFFDPADQTSLQPRDALYLDTKPGLTSFGIEGVIQTAAHEYQHLIHWNYDVAENTFVNEGLSEWAEILNGYRARSVTYLNDLDEQRLPLMDWADFGDIGTVEQYQRAGLFTTYLAERIGPVEAGSITRETGRGDQGYQAVLNRSALDLNQVVRDFHVANRINNRDVRPAYGYETSQYVNLQAALRTSSSGAGETSIGPTTYGPLPPGAVDYHLIEYVQDLELRLYVPATEPNPSVVPLRVKPVVVLFLDDGSVQVHEITIQDAWRSYAEVIRRAVIIVPHASLSTILSALSYGFEASWTPSAAAYQTEAVAHEDGTLASAGDIYGFPPNARAANRFDVPAGSILSSASVSVMFESDFSNSQATSNVRDYTLKVWGESAEGSGVPAATPIFSLDRTDSRTATLVTNGVDTLFVFDPVNLEAYQAQLSGLPATVFLSVENAGADDNYLAYPVGVWDTGQGDSPSLFYASWSSGEGWRKFSQLSVNQESINNRVLPIRATFLVPTAVANEESGSLPEGYALEANWPNPFNPSTTIAYRLPASGRVRLQVFDLLGRRVATLVDGVMPAGRHETRFDAGSLASGLYLYALEAGSQRISRPMMLVK